MSETRTAIVPKMLALTMADTNIANATTATYTHIELHQLTSKSVRGAISISPNTIAEWYIITEYLWKISETKRVVEE